MGYCLTYETRTKTCTSGNAYPLVTSRTPGRRFLQVQTGRWLSRDPIAERGGLNLYGFVGNEPVGRWDAKGLMTRGEAESACAAAMNARMQAISDSYPSPAKFELVGDAESFLTGEIGDATGVGEAQVIEHSSDPVEPWVWEELGKAPESGMQYRIIKYRLYWSSSRYDKSYMCSWVFTYMVFGECDEMIGGGVDNPESFEIGRETIEGGEMHKYWEEWLLSWPEGQPEPSLGDDLFL